MEGLNPFDKQMKEDRPRDPFLSVVFVRTKIVNFCLVMIKVKDTPIPDLRLYTNKGRSRISCSTINYLGPSVFRYYKIVNVFWWKTNYPYLLQG